MMIQLKKIQVLKNQLVFLYSSAFIRRFPTLIPDPLYIIKYKDIPRVAVLVVCTWCIAMVPFFHLFISTHRSLHSSF